VISIGKAIRVLAITIAMPIAATVAGDTIGAAVVIGA
jgi:hypothetical protein